MKPPIDPVCKVRDIVMKTKPTNRKKKDKTVNIESATRDTIAETIAFVIKGQLTPIKPTLQQDEKTLRPVKGLNKTKWDRIKEKAIKQELIKRDDNTDEASRSNVDKPGLVKKLSNKIKTNRDVDLSIQKIIKKYAKKFNIKTDKVIPSQSNNEEKKSACEEAEEKAKKVKAIQSRLRKKSVTMMSPDKMVKARRKYVKRKVDQDRNKDNYHECKDTDIEIKQEKINQQDLPDAIKSEPEENKEPSTSNQDIVELIKKEPVSDEGIQESDSTSTKSNDKAPAKKTTAAKKNIISRRHKRMDEKRRAKLIQFWNSPKRHRVASLNAIAKVHCLYENESNAAFERIAESTIIKKESITDNQANKQEIVYHKISDTDSDSDSEPVRRTLRDVPGLRGVGKHWDMHDSISSDNNSDIIEISRPKRKVVRVKKETPAKKTDKPKKTQPAFKKKRQLVPEVSMDLKDMVVKKRMASLNASAILAASYSSDKNKPVRSANSSSYDSDSSAEEYFAAVNQIDFTRDIKEVIKREEDQSNVEAPTTPNKKVAVILNQDTDVTITGVYVNSTTRSTHHEGYCSIAGMQYRISATSHTQTAATAVATETLIQPSSGSENAHSDAQSCSSKSYTPLDALSNMQPPPGPGIHNAPAGHPGVHCQSIHQLSSPQHRDHSSSSAFSSPHHVPIGPYQPPVQTGLPPPPPPPGESPHGYIHGYYQPAGPLISVTHGHNPAPTQPTLPKSVPLSDASPTSVNSSAPQSQPPPSNGDSSDNEVIITSVTAGTKDPPPTVNHPPNPGYHPRYPYSQYHSYPAFPPQYHYPTAPPSAPYPHHEICYTPTAPSGYMRHAKYGPSPSSGYHRYPYYGGDMYPPSSAPQAQPNQQIVSANPPSFSSSSNVPPPPPTAMMESYAPPQAPPTLVDAYQQPSHYFQSAYSLPPTCYSHSPTRTIPFINASYQHCPCPLNTCPKNGHTGPLTGEGKRSNIAKDSKPLSPVALALPLEPASATGPPSPARGSAGMPAGGMPPPPSPAGANYQPPLVPTPKMEMRSVDVSEFRPEKRKARVGKANVRNNMQNTMLLMCNPAQDYVKREVESPPENELEISRRHEEVVVQTVTIPEACIETTCTNNNNNDIKTIDLVEKKDTEEPLTAKAEEVIEPVIEPLAEKAESKDCQIAPLKEELLPPCIATVAENVKVKNMKRKQSQSEKVPEAPPPPVKKKKLSSYKDFIRKHTSCFKIRNGKKKLISQGARGQQTKIKTQTPKKKLNVTKEQTNNRRMKVCAKTTDKKKSDKSATKILDNLIAKNNVDRVIDDVSNNKKRSMEVKKPPKTSKTKGAKRRKSVSKSIDTDVEVEVKVCRKSAAPKWSNGWTWEGESYESKVFINSDETTLVRRCYPSMRHREGDLIRPGDCVLLKAGPRKNDLPYVAKIAALWENAEDGEMMMSLLWYYRPEHTEQGRVLTDQPDEVFASRHKDSNSVACIDDKCWVLTFNEYCRYKKNFKRMEEGLEERPRCVPLPDPYPRLRKQPPSSNISLDMVFFCRRVYDFRQKRLIKNPT